MTDRRERARQAQVRHDSDERHRRVWGVPRPRDAPPRRAELPPEPGRGPGYDLPVTHVLGCDEPRIETTSWYAAGTGVRVLTVTRCLDCEADARRRGP